METKRSFAKTGSGLTHQSLRKKFKTNFSFSVHRYGSAGRVSVAFATSDGVALAGKDYIAQKGNLVFEDGADNAFVFRAIPRLKTIKFTKTGSGQTQLWESSGNEAVFLQARRRKKSVSGL
jgi:hypothetical protein